MVRTSFSRRVSPAIKTVAGARLNKHIWPVAGLCALAGLLAAGTCAGQVITIDTSGKARAPANAPVERRYAQITPTNVSLPKGILDEKSKIDLIRTLQAEQGFAMRPFPRGHKGLTLVANGKLEPAGEAYLNMAIAYGTSAKPGDRVVLTDVKFDHSKLVFELNGGPDLKHRFLRHISIGGDPNYSNPVVADDGQEAVGARLTLTFNGPVPELTGAQVKALLAPLISFDVKTPIQAFTDTLPPELKSAILGHHVMVGMSTDMVLFAKGQPETKTREMDGQMPFEEWIYGKPPEEVDFVRINGNRVIRVEVAKMGVSPVIFTKDEVTGLMRTDGTPVETAAAEGPKTHVSEVGDVQRDPDKQAPATPPSLRLPSDDASDQSGKSGGGGQKNVGVMRPVQFPKEKPAAQPGANPDSVPDQEPAATTGANQNSSASSGQNSQEPAAAQKPPTPAAGTNAPN